jgi:hypothetical protein
VVNGYFFLDDEVVNNALINLFNFFKPTPSFSAIILALSSNYETFLPFD